MSDDVTDRFIDDILLAVQNCLTKGESWKISVPGKFGCTIDIHPTAASMKKFDSVILDAVKKQTGIDLVKDIDDNERGV